jgi:hypothetical protein
VTTRKSVQRAIRAGLVAAVFGAGYLAGSVSQPVAQAQVGDLGGEALKKAGESGGMLGQAAELGTTITSMQESVNELQKSLETLNKIKAALGG